MEPLDTGDYWGGQGTEVGDVSETHQYKYENIIMKLLLCLVNIY